MTVSTLSGYAVGGYQPPNPSKILTKLFDKLEATSTTTAADSTETTTSSTQTTNSGQSTGASVGQLSDSIMSMLFGLQLQESGGGQPPQPPADNENTPQQALQKFFSSIDSDGDGNVSQTELGSFLQASGGSEEDAAKVFSSLDTDGNGSVSEDELKTSVERGRPQRAEHRPPPSPADLAEKLFTEVDTDGNGSLTKTELDAFVKANGGTTEQADAAYANLDSESTGAVTKDQLVAAAEELEATKPTTPPAESARGRADLSPWLRFVDALAMATKTTSNVAVAV